MIYVATAADIPILTDMALRFIRESEYNTQVTLTAERAGVILSHLIAQGSVFIAKVSANSDPVGMIGMAKLEHPFSQELIATEIFWWVNPETRHGKLGIQLLQAGEKWATFAGCKRIQMIAPNEKVESMYARLGYSKVETMYQRSL